jgi:hypothetical protein
MAICGWAPKTSAPTVPRKVKEVCCKGKSEVGTYVDPLSEMYPPIPGDEIFSTPVWYEMEISLSPLLELKPEEIF